MVFVVGVVSKEGDEEVPVFNFGDVETAESWQGFAFFSSSSSSPSAFGREQPSFCGLFRFASSEERRENGSSFSVGKDAVGVSADADGLVTMGLLDGYDMMMMVMRNLG